MLLYQNMNFLEELKIFLLAMTPIGELRLSIPFGITVYKIDPFLVYFISIIGNFLVSLIILFGMKLFVNYLSNFSMVNRFLNYTSFKTKSDYSLSVKKYGPYFLFFFVALPFPFTGVWTASLISFFFRMPILKSLVAIFLGVSVAGVFVLLFTQMGIAIENFFGINGLIGFFVLLISCYLFFRRKNYVQK